MLFSEQLRIIKDEEQILNDSTVYQQSTNTDWITKRSVQFTLTSTKIVGILGTWRGNATASHAAGRILLNNTPIISTGGIQGGATVTRRVYLLLPSGTYTVDFQAAVWVANSSYPFDLRQCTVGAFNFPDKSSSMYDSGYVSIPANTTSTLIDVNFNTPATRKLAVGKIKGYVVRIVFYGERQDQRVSKVKNSSDANEANYFNWRILLNNNAQDWTEKQDDITSDTTNLTYGEGCYGLLERFLPPSTQYNLKITCYNGFSSSYNGRALIAIFICPWIIPNSEYEPIELDFPQGSTLYIIVEPFLQDPTKYVKIGKRRGVSFGDSTDYYSLASGTGILSHSYTFEIIDVSNALLLISGLGGCISVLAVDVR